MREVIGSEQHRLDAVILADVGMDMHSVILANSRLAPIQVRVMPAASVYFLCKLIYVWMHMCCFACSMQLTGGLVGGKHADSLPRY